jgi:hypothetical protein
VGEGSTSANSWAREKFLTELRHKQPVGHALLEMLDHRALDAGNRDRQRLARTGAVVLRAKDHDAVLALAHRPPRAAPEYADAMFNLGFCYTEAIGTRKRRSTGGAISSTTLNLNGQHGRADP